MLNLALQPKTTQPLYRQIVEQIQMQILNGELEAEQQLPPTRSVAATYGVSRVTVKAAYEQLAAEGFIASRQGSGTFVVPLPLGHSAAEAVSLDLSAWAERALQTQSPRQRSRKLTYDFGFGRSFPQLFPYDVWRKLL
ncbi:MAG: GntR family transcriptional regulator, partial [Candidatus Promineifilaceae bacterium]